MRHSPSGRGWSGVLRHDPTEEATSAIEELSGRPQYRAAARSRASLRLRSRVVLEALLEISRGKPIDEVLQRYRKVAVSTYRAIGADVMPIHQEFEAAWRAWRSERS